MALAKCTVGCNHAVFREEIRTSWQRDALTDHEYPVWPTGGDNQWRPRVLGDRNAWRCTFRFPIGLVIVPKTKTNSAPRWPWSLAFWFSRLRSSSFRLHQRYLLYGVIHPRAFANLAFMSAFACSSSNKANVKSPCSIFWPTCERDTPLPPDSSAPRSECTTLVIGS